MLLSMSPKPSLPSFSQTAGEVRRGESGVQQQENILTFSTPPPRVINMSSDWGKIYRIGPRRQREILDPDLTVEKLSSLMDEFVR